jgi:hypothetical protein
MIKYFIKDYFRMYHVQNIKTKYYGKIILNKFVFISKKRSDSFHLKQILSSNKKNGYITFIV